MLAFVGEDLAVGQAGVVVDGGVDVAVADHRLAALALVGGGLPVAVAGLSADRELIGALERLALLPNPG
ncbi:hypothetical protein [Streptomyces sp. NPDC006368]|uniref:hypothetical protein n=1 Tax=Streptomyces sp. NPDC006368 TaxID=3156760 RepID=UPI0033A45D8F